MSYQLSRVHSVSDNVLIARESASVIALCRVPSALFG